MRSLYFLCFLCPVIWSCGNDKSPKLKDNEEVIYSADSLTQAKANTDELKKVFRKTGDTYHMDWSYLLSTRFESKYDENLTMEVEVPVFSDTLKVINGEKVRISGYYIPVDETGDENIVILSAYPYAQCFFCGQAGVESIVDILPAHALPRLKTDDKVTFEGNFKLNKDDYDYLIYILEDAVLVQAEDRK